MSLTKSGIWYPDGNFTANPRVIAAQQAANLESVISTERLRHGSVEYATVGARDLANPTPQQGDQCTVAGVPMTYFTTGGWAAIRTNQGPSIQSGGIGLTWGSLTNTLTTLHTATIPAQSIRTLVIFIMGFTGSLTGTGYLNVNLLVNGTNLLTVRQSGTQQTTSGVYPYTVAANTVLTVTVTGATSVSTTSSSVSSNGIYNYLRWMLIPA